MFLQGSPGPSCLARRNKVRRLLALVRAIGALTSQWTRLHILLWPLAQLTGLVLGELRMDGLDSFGKYNN